MTQVVLFSSLELIFTTIKTKFKIFIFLHLGPYRGMQNIQAPCSGGSSKLISNFLSSMILYNHSSYLKSGEINNCRLSPLPTCTEANVFNEKKGSLRGHNCVLFFSQATVYCYPEFKLRYFKNLKLFSIGLKELFELNVL